MNTNIRCFILLLFCAVLPSLVMANVKLVQAQTSLEQGDIDRALNLTNEVLAETPNNIEARFMKGLILTRSERLEEAEDVFDQLTRDHPELPEPYNNLAVVYAAQGKFEEAGEALKNAINTHPSYATAHENLGDIYAKMASRAYNQALELDDGNVSAREKLSLIKELFSAPPDSSKEEETETVVAKVEPTPEPQPKQIEETVPEPVTLTEPTPEPEAETAMESVEVVQPAPVVQIDPQIEVAINQWANAWSSQDVSGYLSFYSDNFVPQFGMSRSTWSEQRRKRLHSPGYIKIDVSAVKIRMIGTESAEATFTQSYSSDTFQDWVTKKLLMQSRNGQWKIVEEQSY